MRIRAVSDIHGNIHAFESVLADPDGCGTDLTVCLGDIVGYGAFPSRCIAAVRENCDLVVTGNHDSGATGSLPMSRFNSLGARALKWIRPRLSKGELDWLSELPLELSSEGFLFCHSDPAAPAGWAYVRDVDHACRGMESRPGLISVIGHTHLPGCWTRSGGFSEDASGPLDAAGVLNCGSVGQPRDGSPMAAYMILDTGSGTWEHRRVSYDVRAAADAIRDVGLPEVLAERLFMGR